MRRRDGGRIVDFVKTGEMSAPIGGLRELLIMFGEMRDLRPIIGFLASSYAL